ARNDGAAVRSSSAAVLVGTSMKWPSFFSRRDINIAASILLGLLVLALAFAAVWEWRVRHAPLEHAAVTPLLQPPLTPLFDDLEKRTFDYFWNTANPDNGLIPDRYPYTEAFASIAAVGFGLTAYGIGVERGYITRDQAVQRTLVTLRFFEGAPQGSRAEGMAGYHGFYYHFLDLRTGA